MPSVRILIAADSRSDARALQRRLERLGHEVVSVVPATEPALLRAAHARPHVILVDPGASPSGDGAMAAADMGACLGIPVVVLTDRALPEAERGSARDRSCTWLSKPATQEALRATIAIALRGPRFEQALARDNRQLEFLNEAAHALASAPAPDRTLAEWVGPTAVLLAADAAALWLLDSASHELVCSQALGQYAQRALGQRTRAGQGVAGWVSETGEVLIAQDLATDERCADVAQRQAGPPLRSLIAVCLRVDTEPLGALELAALAPAAFAPADAAFLTSLACSAACAIARRREVEALRQRASELEAQFADAQDFAHTVAHDLKAPLSIVAGFADALEERYDDLPPAEFKQHLKSISATAFRMNAIIQELLLLAQLRRGEVPVEPIDMASITHRALQRLGPLVKEHGAQVSLPASWPAVMGYAPWIEEVWANYISNAIQYGGRPPQVDLGADAQPGGTVLFWVRDNGQGIPRESQARLFLATTYPSQGYATGHGLGLSIVARIMAKLEGAVGVESSPGRGSRFTFTLRSAEPSSSP